MIRGLQIPALGKPRKSLMNKYLYRGQSVIPEPGLIMEMRFRSGHQPRIGRGEFMKHLNKSAVCSIPYPIPCQFSLPDY